MLCSCAADAFRSKINSHRPVHNSKHLSSKFEYKSVRIFRKTEYFGLICLKFKLETLVDIFIFAFSESRIAGVSYILYIMLSQWGPSPDCLLPNILLLISLGFCGREGVPIILLLFCKPSIILQLSANRVKLYSTWLLILYSWLFPLPLFVFFPWMQIAMIDRGKPSLENPPLLQWESL